MKPQYVICQVSMILIKFCLYGLVVRARITVSLIFNIGMCATISFDEKFFVNYVPKMIECQL